MAWFVCLEQLPARPLIFSFGSGVTFGPGRGTAGGCSVTPCQGVFLIRRVSCGLACVPGTIACQTFPSRRARVFSSRPLIFSFGSGVTFGPGRGTAGGCSVTPCQGVFLIRRVSCGLACVPGTIACQTLDFRHAVPGCFPDSKGVLWLGLCAWNNCLPDP